MNDVAAFANGAALVGQLADKLGVDKNVVAAINKGAQIASTAQSVLAGIAAGPMGYLSAANAVAGLMGGGEDIGQQRHNQIVGLLKEISGDIKDIKSKLETMDKKLNIIAALQKETLQSIADLSNSITEKHSQTMGELGKIRNDLKTVTEIVRDNDLKGIEGASVLLDRLAGLGYADARSASFRVLVQAYGDEFSPPHAALLALQEKLTSPLTLHTYRLSNYKGHPGGEVEVFLDNVYPTTWNLLCSLIEESEALGWFAALTCPTKHVRGAWKKYEQLKKPDFPLLLSSFEGVKEADYGHLKKHLENPLSASLLERHVGYLVKIYPMLDMEKALAQNSIDPYIDAPEQKQPDSLFALKGALLLCEIAIAQNALLSGDLFLPLLHLEWERLAAPKADMEEIAQYEQRRLAYENFLVLLRKAVTSTGNPLLGENLVKYIVHRELKRTGNSLMYAAALVSSDPRFVRSVIPEYLDLKWETASKRWVATVGELDLPLPSARDALDGELKQIPIQERLLWLKQILINEIEGYNVLHALPNEKYATILAMAWNNSIIQRKL